MEKFIRYLYSLYQVKYPSVNIKFNYGALKARSENVLLSTLPFPSVCVKLFSHKNVISYWAVFQSL